MNQVVQKHFGKISIVTMISAMISIGAALGVFGRGISSVAVADNKLTEVVARKGIHIEEHKEVADDVSTIKNDVKWIKEFIVKNK